MMWMMKWATGLVLCLMIYGCCSAPAVQLQTAPLTLPAAGAATVAQASWFVTVQPGVESSSAALEACLDGDPGRLERVFAVVEVGASRIAVAGNEAVALDGGMLPAEASEGFLIHALHRDLQALVDDSRQVAAIGCRPWELGVTPPPGASRDLPPLLLVMDAGTSVPLAMQVLYTASMAEFDVTAWLVNDETPGELPPPGGERPGFDQIMVQLSDRDVAWSYHEDAAPQTGGAAPSGSGTVEQFSAALPALIPEGIPGAMIQLGGGTVGSVVSVQDALVQQGVHCATLAAGLEDSPAAPAFPATGTPTTLDSAGALSVLPVFLPVVAIARPGPPPYQTLLTGHECPVSTVMMRVKTPETLDMGNLGLDVEILEGAMDMGTGGALVGPRSGAESGL